MEQFFKYRWIGICGVSWVLTLFALISLSIEQSTLFAQLCIMFAIQSSMFVLFNRYSSSRSQNLCATSVFGLICVTWLPMTSLLEWGLVALLLWAILCLIQENALMVFVGGFLFVVSFFLAPSTIVFALFPLVYSWYWKKTGRPVLVLCVGFGGVCVLVFLLVNFGFGEFVFAVEGVRENLFNVRLHTLNMWILATLLVYPIWQSLSYRHGKSVPLWIMMCLSTVYWLAAGTSNTSNLVCVFIFSWMILFLGGDHNGDGLVVRRTNTLERLMVAYYMGGVVLMPSISMFLFTDNWLCPVIQQVRFVGMDGLGCGARFVPSYFFAVLAWGGIVIVMLIASYDLKLRERWFGLQCSVSSQTDVALDR